MVNLKISQFVDGGAVQTGDEIATNRSGLNTKVRVGSAAAADIGSGPDDLSTNSTLTQNLANSLMGTSTTANDLTLGTLTFVTQTYKPFETGRNILFVSDSDPLNLRMNGVVTDYNPATGNLEVSIQKVVGTGNYADWTLFVTGDLGPQGEKGWSPILAVVIDPESSGVDRNVLQVVSWTGGEGSMPATGQYIGPSGLVNDIWDAVDIRGAQGEQGEKGDQGDPGPPGPGTGDVVGPSSATDNAVARFDLTTGKLIQNSSLVVNDAGEITTGVFKGTPVHPDYLQFAPYAASASSGTYTMNISNGPYQVVTSAGATALAASMSNGQAILVTAIDFDSNPLTNSFDWGDTEEPEWTGKDDFIVYRGSDGAYRAKLVNGGLS